jgi:hypothetical protein
MGEVYKAIDLIPRDCIIGDWHYYPTENYHTNEYFLGKGFEVWNTTWFLRDNTVRFAKHGKQVGARGMLMSTWTRPELASLPVESVLFAGVCFQSIAEAEKPETAERLLVSAHRLWREWQTWQNKR